MNTRQFLEIMGTKLTVPIARRYGRDIPFIYVIEYPKSGGNWLARMVADCLQIPFPNKPMLPVAFKSVLHTHWQYMPELENVIYLYRDGRDIVVSRYFHCLRALKEVDSARSWSRFGLRQVFVNGGFEEGINNAAEYLPEFIQTWNGSPHGCKVSWKEHVGGWLGHSNVIYTSYEALSEDCEGELFRILSILKLDKKIEQSAVAATAKKFSFENQTGRARGDADNNSFIRKGIVGDWQNHFSDAAKSIFEEICGEVLVNLSYENDDSWVKK